MLQFSTDAAGNALYYADADEDTSGFYQVGSDAAGNAIYSDVPNAAPNSTIPQAGSVFDSILNTFGNVYATKSLIDLNAQRQQQGLPPVTNIRQAATKPFGIPQLIIIGAVVGMVIYISKQK